MNVRILYSEACPHCHELIENLKKQNGIPGINLKYVELDSDEGMELVESTVNSIDGVPVAFNEQNLKCEITYGIDNKVQIECPM